MNRRLHELGEKWQVTEPARAHEPSPTPSPATVINAPGGIGISGGNVSNPTVINYGPRALVISSQQQQALKAAVAPFANQFARQKINISIHNANPETTAFGEGISKAFAEAGFQTNTGPVTFIGASLSRGVTIRFGANRENIAVAVRESLLKSGSVDKVYAAKGISDDDFLIIVAP